MTAYSLVANKKKKKKVLGQGPTTEVEVLPKAQLLYT